MISRNLSFIRRALSILWAGPARSGWFAPKKKAERARQGHTGPNSGGWTLVESRESAYGNICVEKKGSHVTLSFSPYSIESAYNTADALELPALYPRTMTAGLIYARNINSILEIGGGAGRTAWYLHHYLPAVSVTSVELDPTVIELSRKYFGLRDESSFRMANGDGRTFLFLESQARYDIIMIDVYREGFVPLHLRTKEFYELVRDRLTEGGVMVQNIAPRTLSFGSTMKTLQAVFPQIDTYPAQPNVVAIAYTGSPYAEDDLQRRAAERQNALGLRYDLPGMLVNRRPFDGTGIGPRAQVLTDDFAPAEALEAMERHNQKKLVNHNP